MSVDVRFIRIFSHTHIDRYYLRREILRNNTGRHRTETHVIFSFFEKKKSHSVKFFSFWYLNVVKRQERALNTVDIGNGIYISARLV